MSQVYHTILRINHLCTVKPIFLCDLEGRNLEIDGSLAVQVKECMNSFPWSHVMEEDNMDLE